MADLITFAVGDIHGCFEKLTALMAACDAASAGRSARFVFIGDYVDRGPDTRKVIEFLIEKQRQREDRFICLRGNHEDLLVRAADRVRTGRDLMNWWANGGEQTLDSHGVNDPSDLPPDHLVWIKALPLKFSQPARLFVHAGFRPGVSISDQTEKDMIHEPFLSSAVSHGPFVIHGHTPTETGLPDLRPNRLNIDTGACFDDPLTAAMFSDTQTLPIMFVNNFGTTW